MRGGDRWSVVVVDDSAEIRTLVRRRLELSGFFDVVAEGADGDEAVGLVHRHQPALLLLDASMPTADGLEALPGILAVSPATKVVMFTGFEDRGLAARARELGAVGFVEKSVSVEELVQRLLRVANAEEAPEPARDGQVLRLVTRASAREDSQSGEEQDVLGEHIARYREVFDRAALPMATMTTTGTIIRANRALADLLDCRPSDLVGIDYGRLTGGRGDELDRALEAMSSAGEDRTAFAHAWPEVAGAEHPRTVRLTLTPIRDAKRMVLYVFGQVEDITAQRAAEDRLRRSEETFRLLVSSIGRYAIFMLDVAGNVISWNPGAHRIKRYRAGDIIGRSFRVFYTPEEQAAGRPEQNLRAALRDGFFAEEGWRVRQDGSRFWASVVISPVFDDAGRHIGFAKVTHDQSDREPGDGRTPPSDVG